MATNETQPGEDQRQTAADGVAAEEENAAAPTEKSGVRVDPDALDNPGGRFRENDVVHMSMIEGGIRIKGVFTVASARLHSSRTFYEYQLVDGSGRWYQGGTWVRERDLRMERRR